MAIGFQHNEKYDPIGSFNEVVRPGTISRGYDREKRVKLSRSSLMRLLARNDSTKEKSSGNGVRNSHGELTVPFEVSSSSVVVSGYNLSGAERARRMMFMTDGDISTDSGRIKIEELLATENSAADIQKGKTMVG